VCALVDEAELTPKPALVDRRGSGAHDDMDLGMLRRSAHALRPTFAALAAQAHGRAPSQQLREELAAIGRRGEREMLAVTGGVNTHRGAIWTLGLLAAAASMAQLDAGPARVATLAGRVATFRDRYSRTRRRTALGSVGATAWQARAERPGGGSRTSLALRCRPCEVRAQPGALLRAPGWTRLSP